MRSRDKFRGCLIGGAAGDALGYAVEFIGEKEIFREYDEKGITAYALTRGKALISDDTQMTLFTAAGLLQGGARGNTGGYAGSVNRAYLDWLKTQEEAWPLPEGSRHSWLVNVPELFSPRAPGNTCLSALRMGGGGSPEQPINHSKGCGGVMRVAPIGLYFNDDGRYGLRDVCRLGAEAAALTHGHPLGWLPGGALAAIIHAISQDGASIPDAVRRSLDAVDELWPDEPKRAGFRRLMETALSLAESDIGDLEAVHQLGEGWVGDEALAIAVCCAARYPGDIDKTLVAAVNHKGDSDSTGAIAGNIAGALVGLAGIPAKYTDGLELRDVIIELADDLWAGRRTGGPGGGDDPVWTRKYVDMTYRP